MNVKSKMDAQSRVDDIEAFGRELARIEADGAIELTQSQRQGIAHYHKGLIVSYEQLFEVDADVRAKQLSLGMRIASFLGALAFAASLFFLFRQFWDLFPMPAQVAVLISAPLLALWGTMALSERDRGGYFAKLAAMVAFACFVLNVWLLGVIFNLTPSDNAFIAWGAFAFLLAYACDLRLLLAAGILCTMGWIAARTGTLGGLYWLHFGERPENFFPAAVVFFLLPVWFRHERFASFASVYRIFGLLALFMPILVLSNWGYGSYLHADRNVVEGAYQVLGFALAACAIWSGARNGWPDVVNTAMVFFVIFLYTKFFDWWWEVMPKYLFFLVLALVAVLLLLALRRVRSRVVVAAGGSR